MKKKILVILIFSLFSFIFAQSKKDSKDIFFKDYVSRIWTVEDGIPGNTITDIFQAADGYIYFGTYSGVTRFDGVKFLNFNKFFDPKYDFLSARSLMQDSRGNIWVGSNDEGAYCLKSNGDVLSFSTDNGLSNNSIRSFCEDKDGNIWVGTAFGINCINPSYELEQLQGFSNIPLDNKFIVVQLYCDTAGRIWIVTRSENGLYLYEKGNFSVYKGIHSVKNPIVTTISQDSTGAYWFGIAPHYAIKIVAGEETLHNVGYGSQKGTIVTSIYEDTSKNVWFGLDNGITILHDGIYSYFHKENGLSDDSITKIIEDEEKNIWIATDHGGVQKLSYGKFQTVSMATTINVIAQDNFRDVVWLAGDDGLYCYKNNDFIENEITKYCKNIRIRHVCVTDSGELLVSTYEKLGQLKFNLDGSVESWTKNSGIAGNRVRVAEKVSNGDLYIGTTTGLSIVDSLTGEITNLTKNKELDNDYIMCLYEDSDKNIWVGTDGGGIFILKDKKIIKTLKKSDGLVGNVIFKIQNFDDDNIWICTGSGISRYKNGEFFSLDSSNGFASDGVFQFIPDISGRMWGTTNRGIFYVKQKDIDDLIDGKKSLITPKYFGRLDGIISGGITATSLSMQDNFGRLWFTLIDGFTIFDPIRNASKNSAPKVKIESVVADGENIEIKDGKVIIPPVVKRLIINYTGISFISSEQITFKTKLEGFDKEFSGWETSRSSSYTNLKPGKYTFYVCSQNGDEVSTGILEKVIIEKKPFFWQRTSFIVSIILIVVFIVALIIYLRMVHLKKEQLRTEKVFIEIIRALTGTIDAKDKYTKGHSNRVAEYSKKLASLIGLPKERQKLVYYTALLHDIGKIGIPDSIINKPGKLTPEEYEIIKQHPVIGSQILSSISSMKEIAMGVRNHHERFDGNGYPDGLKGEEIPLIARIIAVADTYDAMTSNRSYRSFMAQKDVRAEILKNRGLQFDPELADKMIEIIDKDIEYILHE